MDSQITIGVAVCPLSGVKRTSQLEGIMSANDPLLAQTATLAGPFRWHA